MKRMCGWRNLMQPVGPVDDMARPISALLIIDMINLFDFEGGRRLAKEAARIAPRIARLKARFSRAGAPIIYVNDNFMDWRADFKELIAICSHPENAGAESPACWRPVRTTITSSSRSIPRSWPPRFPCCWPSAACGASY